MDSNPRCLQLPVTSTSALLAIPGHRAGILDDFHRPAVRFRLLLGFLMGCPTWTKPDFRTEPCQPST